MFIAKPEASPIRASESSKHSLVIHVPQPDSSPAGFLADYNPP